MSRKTIFILSLLYLTALLAVGLTFFVRRDLLFFVPDNFGPVAVGVPWFGALGAVLISLTGVFQHEHDWDSSFWPWHVARPLVGVALGVVSVLIMQAGILAVGSTPIQSTAPPASTSSQTPSSQTPSSQTPSSQTPNPTPAPNNATPTPTPAPGAGTTTPTPAPSATPTDSSKQNQPKVPGNLLYYLVAFLVGYREETFRELIKRLVDIILAPGSKSADAPTIHDVTPTQAPHGTATQVVISGSGFTNTQSVKFGVAAAQFTVNGDSKLTATTPVLAAAPGAPVRLTVTTKEGSAGTDFTFS